MRLEEEDNNLILVQWYAPANSRSQLPNADMILPRWKLRLRPESMSTPELREALKLCPLPPNADVGTTIFPDFLRYLFNCAKSYIIESHVNGPALWNSAVDRIDVVLSHPNGWEGLQQAKMREAAVSAGLIPDTPDGHARVRFVTEGEASMHYCIERGIARDVSQVRALQLLDMNMR